MRKAGERRGGAEEILFGDEALQLEDWGSRTSRGRFETWANTNPQGLVREASHTLDDILDEITEQEVAKVRAIDSGDGRTLTTEGREITESGMQIVVSWHLYQGHGAGKVELLDQGERGFSFGEIKGIYWQAILNDEVLRGDIFRSIEEGYPPDGDDVI